MASRSNKSMRYAPPAQPMVSSAPKSMPRAGIANAVRSAVTSRKPKATSATLARGIANAAMGTDRNGNRTGPRPTVGPADAATRRAALDKALQPGPPVRSAPKLRPQVAPVDASGAGGRARSRKIDDLVNKMQ